MSVLGYSFVEPRRNNNNEASRVLKMIWYSFGYTGNTRYDTCIMLKNI